MLEEKTSKKRNTDKKREKQVRRGRENGKEL